MKNAIVNFQTNSFTINGETCNLIEAGLHENADGGEGYQFDKSSIVDSIFERFEDVEVVEFIGGEFQNFAASAEIADLESLGWEFDIDQNDGATRENWYIRIVVDAEGGTYWYMQMHAHAGNETADGGQTGDDAETIADLRTLREASKLWDIDERHNL